MVVWVALVHTAGVRIFFWDRMVVATVRVHFGDIAGHTVGHTAGHRAEVGCIAVAHIRTGLVVDRTVEVGRIEADCIHMDLQDNLDSDHGV